MELSGLSSRNQLLWTLALFSLLGFGLDRRCVGEKDSSIELHCWCLGNCVMIVGFVYNMN